MPFRKHKPILGVLLKPELEPDLEQEAQLYDISGTWAGTIIETGTERKTETGTMVQFPLCI